MERKKRINTDKKNNRMETNEKNERKGERKKKVALTTIARL